jgi:hypothetical protein
MGGQGSGGTRAGSGRKKRTPIERVLDGSASRGERDFVNDPTPIIPVARPLNLGQRERVVG